MSDRRFDSAQLGDRGEDRALAWYLERGYRLVDRNWRCRSGEIDLIVAKDREVVFSEVKTRSSTRFGTPFEAVDQRKQRRIRSLAAIWLSSHPSAFDRPIRFDVVSVIGTRVEVRERAF